jgi:hypothetical protein
MYKINLNDYIYVSLTRKGEQVLIDYHNNLDLPEEFKRKPEELLNEARAPLRTDKGEFYYKFQIWEFMSLFGDKIQLGEEPLFDMSALLEKEPIKE